VPFVKWAGGKSQLLTQMAPFFPRELGTFFEPFVGGGAVFFHIRPERAVVADLNPELVNAYVIVKRAPKSLMKALDRHKLRSNDEAYYYQVRAIDPDSLSPVDRAARLIFLNKTCFNGLYRVNSRGKFNVPWGGYKNPAVYSRENLLAASRLLKGKNVLCCDYKLACQTAADGDFVYLDPPYHPGSPSSTFTAYTREDFREKEQRELAVLFKDLTARGCKVMLSNSGTPLVRGLYEGFRIEVLSAKRAINSKGTGRGPVDELLIMNFR
jgi:DNA adenine methylase